LRRAAKDARKTARMCGCHYFPPTSVRMEFLQSAPKTEGDYRCPHSERAAWPYEAPRASYAHVAHWIGFWNDVELQR